MLSSAIANPAAATPTQADRKGSSNAFDQVHRSRPSRTASVVRAKPIAPRNALANIVLDCSAKDAAASARMASMSAGVLLDQYDASVSATRASSAVTLNLRIMYSGATALALVGEGCTSLMDERVCSWCSPFAHKLLEQTQNSVFG